MSPKPKGSCTWLANEGWRLKGESVPKIKSNRVVITGEYSYTTPSPGDAEARLEGWWSYPLVFSR